VPKYLAIDIDPQGLFVTAGSVRGGSARVERALAWADEGGPPPLSARTAKEVGEQLRDRLKAAGIAPAPVLVAVGRDRVILKELRYPAVPPAEEPALVRFQAMKEITESPDEVVLDYAPLVNGVADPAAERRSMAVVVRKDVFASVQAMCAAAGLKLAGVTPRPFAVAAGLARAFATGSALPPEAPADAVAVLTLGTHGGEFTVTRGGQVSFTRAVPGPVLASEPLLLAEVRRNLAVYAGQNPAHPVQAVYVAEAEDGVGGWANRLRAALAVPVHPFDPLADAAADVPPAARGRFAGPVGLLAGRAADALPINFAAPRQPKPEQDPKRKQILVAALALLVLVLGGVVFGYLKLDASNKKLAALRQEKADLEDFLKKAEPDAKRLDAVSAWEGRSVSWLDELFDMTDRFPSGDVVRVNSLVAKNLPADPKTGRQVASGDIDLRVAAKNPDAVAGLVAAIDRENTSKKYYVGTQKTLGGIGGGGTDFRHLYTVFTRVNRRPPEEYTRQPTFSPPPRKAAAAAPEPDADQDN
jgi:Tfp pilus assembly PilM family ATPase